MPTCPAVARAIGSSLQLLRLVFIGGRGGKLGGKRKEDGAGWGKAKEEVAWKNMQAQVGPRMEVPHCAQGDEARGGSRSSSL
jgi:hypothetical protein